MRNDKRQPLVSVVIPTWKRPELVCRAVDSALHQTYSNLEVIVVIDGPDNATVERLKLQSDRRVIVIALDKHVGGGKARNTGARAANGKYISLLDDDDEWLPKKIEEQLALAETYPGQDLVIASRYYIRSEGKPDVIRPKRLPRPDEDLSEYVFDVHCGFNTSTFFCNKALFDRTPFTEGLPCLQDVDWYLRIVRQRDVLFLTLPAALAIYNNPSGRSTTTTRSTWTDWRRYGQDHRQLLTKRSYALLMARATRRTDAGIKGWIDHARLFKEMFACGIPSPRTLVLFFCFSALGGQVKSGQVKKSVRGEA